MVLFVGSPSFLSAFLSVLGFALVALAFCWFPSGLLVFSFPSPLLPVPGVCLYLLLPTSVMLICSISLFSCSVGFLPLFLVSDLSHIF